MSEFDPPDDAIDAEAPRRRRSGGKRRTKTKNVPKLPVNALGKKAKPIALDDPPLTIDNVDDFKRSDCRFYAGCLDNVAKSGWDQFHCNGCPIYECNPHIDIEFQEIVARMTRREPG